MGVGLVPPSKASATFENANISCPAYGILGKSRNRLFASSSICQYMQNCQHAKMPICNRRWQAINILLASSRVIDGKSRYSYSKVPHRDNENSPCSNAHNHNTIIIHFNVRER